MPPKKRASTTTTTSKVSPRKKTKTGTGRASRSRASTGKTASSELALDQDAPKHFSAIRCAKWFSEYEDTDEPGVIGPDGVMRFCQDLGVDAATIEVLVIAWKLGAQTMGYFKKDEWLHGMKSLGADSTAKLIKYLDHFRGISDRPEEFKDLYMFAFGFAKESDQKSLSIDHAKGMWQILMPSDRFAHITRFLEFLDEERPVKVINKDQWKSFLEFSTTVAENLHDYDENSAWPVLFDEYVIWKKKRYQEND